MGECVRCGTFTDLPAEGDYQYCEDCRERFAEIETNGVVIEQSDGGYHVYAMSEADIDGGWEDSQVAALARGKHIADDLGVAALFKYEETGSRWVLSEYLRAHPSIRGDVVERLARVPDNGDKGLVDRLKSVFGL